MFNTYSNEDYDRRNEEVDPVASSAEYELEKRVEKLELFPVELEKGGKESENIVSCPLDRITYRYTLLYYKKCSISVLSSFYCL